jgi:hypothetical protein
MVLFAQGFDDAVAIGVSIEKSSLGVQMAGCFIPTADELLNQATCV